MLFEEALKHLSNGEYAQRASWEVVGEYVVLMPGMPHLWKILTQPVPNAGNYLPLMADLLADDWKVMDRVAPPASAAPVAVAA